MAQNANITSSNQPHIVHLKENEYYRTAVYEFPSSEPGQLSTKQAVIERISPRYQSRVRDEDDARGSREGTGVNYCDRGNMVTMPTPEVSTD